MKRYVQLMTDNFTGIKNVLARSAWVRSGRPTNQPGTGTWQGVKRVCSHLFQTGHGTQNFGAVGTWLYRPGVKRPECEFQSNADVKNMCSCTSSPPYLTVSWSVEHTETYGKTLSYITYYGTNGTFCVDVIKLQKKKS
jgi:hypothetical protein